MGLKGFNIEKALKTLEAFLVKQLECHNAREPKDKAQAVIKAYLVADTEQQLAEVRRKLQSYQPAKAKKDTQ